MKIVRIPLTDTTRKKKVLMNCSCMVLELVFICVNVSIILYDINSLPWFGVPRVVVIYASYILLFNIFINTVYSIIPPCHVPLFPDDYDFSYAIITIVMTKRMQIYQQILNIKSCIFIVANSQYSLLTLKNSNYLFFYKFMKQITWYLYNLIQLYITIIRFYNMISKKN